MNSITPVASLAKTAADLVNDASAKVADRADVVDELKDAHDAVTTVARRSDGLMKFVSSYRQLAHLPAPAPGNFLLADLFAEVCRVTTQGWPALGIVLETAVEPPDLDASADRQMLEQVLINLLQNSEHALEGRAGAQVTLTARLSKLGRPSIEIADNGPGIPTDVVEKIFVPFFTTRREGSGVGLALSRQVMIAHGGSINFTNVRPHGARFTLVF
jgi:two-component system nitrogen regulation sensor histidine kinase NtrY